MAWCLFLPLPIRASQKPAWGGCSRIILEPAPGWVPRGAWSHDGAELILADVVGGRLHRYHLDGSYGGATMYPGRGRLDFNRPGSVERTGEGYLVLETPFRLVWLGRDLKPRRGLDLRFSPRAAGQREVGIEKAVSVPGGVVGLAQIHSAEGNSWDSALAHLRFEPAIEAQVLEAIGLDTQEKDLYSIMGVVLAKLGESVYALRFAGPPYLQQVWPVRRRLQAFPSGFETPPELPESRGWESTPIRYKTLETVKTPVGLLGGERFVFILTREPGEKGDTRWRLTGVDPSEDRLTHTVLLPTRAAHLLVVPGETVWALVEKGSVVRAGDQPIETAVIVPAGWIEDPSAKELQHEPIPACSE